MRPLATFAVLAALLCGCALWPFGSPRQPEAVSELKTPDDQAPPAETPEAKVQRLEGELAAAKAEAQAVQVAKVRTLCWWVTGLAVLGAIAAGAVAFFAPTPTAKGFALKAAGCCLVAAALAQVAAKAAPHLWWGGLVVCAGGALYLLRYARHSAVVADESLQFGHMAAERLETLGHKTEADAIKSAAIARQQARGVWKGIHARVQALKGGA